MKSSRVPYLFPLLFAGLSATNPASANLIVNGDFGTGDFSNWSLDDPSNEDDVTMVGPNHYAAALTTDGVSTSLSQNVALTIGQRYTVSFLLVSDGAVPNSFSAGLNGISDVALANVQENLNGVTYVFGFTATQVNSNVFFSVFDDPGYLDVTDVSLVAAAAAPTGVPEPESIALLGIGAVGLILARRWRRAWMARFATACIQRMRHAARIAAISGRHTRSSRTSRAT